MRVAFYAPMKPPGHPRPSGDRRIARLFLRALGLAGFDVFTASEFRSWDGGGGRREKLARRGRQIAEELKKTARADAWFTYHAYHKAPDHLGAAVSRAWGVPYFIAEASVAAKQAGGPWDAGHRQTLACLRAAKKILTLNPRDVPGLRAALGGGEKIVRMKPFLAAPETLPEKSATRKKLALRYKMDVQKTWLVTVAMMRDGDKLRSYRILADALQTLRGDDWRLLVVGDGGARGDVEKIFAVLGGRAVFAGELGEGGVTEALSAGDVFVWPAVNEALGMVLLEAHSCGLPVAAGDGGGSGVAEIVRHGETGLLAPQGDTAAFAAAVARLLHNPALRRRMGRRAAAVARNEHGLDSAARFLGGCLVRSWP